MDDKSVLPTANSEYTNIDSARRETQIAKSGNIFFVDSLSNVLKTITMKIWICILRTKDQKLEESVIETYQEDLARKILEKLDKAN